MTTRAYLAPEFVHPDFGRRRGEAGGLPAAELGLRLSPQRQLSVVEDEAAVRQALLLLLTTRPGERVMRPDYGCHLHALAFAPNDDTTAGLAIHYAQQAIERWEPRVRITHIDALRTAADDSRLDVIVEYLVLAFNRVDRLVVPVPLSGREA